MTYTKVKNIINLIILTVILYSCGNRPNDFKYVTDKIEAYKKQNNQYPTSLKLIDVEENDLCYYLDDDSYNLEFTNSNDLYWYNSANEFWDFLESEATRFHCK